ncbi:Hypothetical protein R9X50_00245400 [Acrodontium crateriforme]|uniref:Zn(2)-C6 fungal-type domain-containing protein n=1 Tax=Acrodontium crateriforme TaxID=150365 RepID=A0AAQ3M0V9_9PEZI|nr:Hypothetical protein R9X50_00245400 [Acrodontium crateriforme]
METSAQQGGLLKTNIKRHAACDECRAKKLKCKGDQRGCARCVRMNIPCVYSAQRQMGRPRKRRNEDAAESLAVTDLHVVAESDSCKSEATPSTMGWNHMTNSDVSHSIGHHDLGMLDGAYMSTDQMPSSWGQLEATSKHWGSVDSVSVPGRTAGSSSLNGPPLLNFSIEQTSHNNQSSQNNCLSNSHRDSSTQLPLDPSLSSTDISSLDASTLPSCACLSTMYLTLSTLQSMNPAFAFPVALHRLREAMSTASEVLACETCPLKFITAIQNTHLMGTLLVSIAERYGKVLESITAETARAEEAGEQKTFRFADLNTPSSHLQMGGLGCSATFNIDLSPHEWNIIAKNVVRAEVHGPAGSNECCSYLVGLAKKMHERQIKWHASPLPPDFPLDANGVPIGGSRLPKEDHLCLRYSHFSNKLVDGFDWS